MENIKFSYKTFLLFICCICAASAQDSVLKNGDVIEFANKFGAIKIKAKDENIREYTWNGETRSVIMMERHKEWMGSRGLYFPGPGEHWKNNNGVTRGVLEEGIRKYKSEKEFKQWIRHRYQSYLNYKYINNGIIGGWAIIIDRKQMNCCIWRIYIDNKLLTKDLWDSIIRG
jgi:hypothetical protein